MNKNEIFPLYVGVNLKIKNEPNPLPMRGYEKGEAARGGCFIFAEVGEGADSVNAVFSISDCQLLLKRLGGMSEGDWKEWEKTMVLIPVPAHPMQVKGMGCDSFLWLIQHGYALSDSWFEGENPIAVEEVE